MALRAAFPSGPLTDATGALSGAWRGFFQSLYSRTGDANGVSTPDISAKLAAEQDARAAGDAALSGAIVVERTARETADAGKLSLSGGTMTGVLTLNALPTAPLQAATKGYVDSAAGTSTAAIPGISYASNGGFAINQRGYVSGTALAAAAFGHDRWKGGASGCTYAFTQSGNPATTITITAGSLQQVVEGAAIVGGAYTLSWTGTAQGRVGAGSYAVSPVTASGITASANTTVEFNVGTLGHVKFEAGSTATPWVADPPQQALARCQRFFQVGGAAWFGGGIGTGTIGSGTTFVVPMRASPTIVFGTPTYANASGIAAGSISAAFCTITATATATAAALFIVTYNASADL